MKRILHVFGFLLALMFVVASPFEAQAQNPKAMKKMRKKARKKPKKSKKPVTYTKRTTRDQDSDGVPDYYDHCLDTPPGATVTSFGCPLDTDFDGLYDYEDECINEPGPKANKGCPYADKDGDGILDKDDKCPEVPGLIKYQGCPDTDGDGIQDSEDACPNEPGLVAYKGCPRPDQDSDGDGILDKDDHCILVPGTVENHGCPEIKKEEKEALDLAFKSLLFESGKAVIKSSSFESLDKLATVMIENDHLLLHLVGHTDNVGDDNDNMKLSESRAKAVRQYLMEHGVDGVRITTEWHGETKPVDTNETADGRKNNRRVEMELKY